MMLFSLQASFDAWLRRFRLSRFCSLPFFFALLTSGSSHLTQMADESGQSKNSSSANTENQAKDKIKRVSTSDNPNSIPNVVSGSASTSTGEQNDVNFATAHEIFTEIAPEDQSVSNAHPLGNLNASSSADGTSQVSPNEQSRVELFRKLATKT